MNQHLSDKDITGYLYQTLTDAGREEMSRHLGTCGGCRERLEREQALQRRIHADLLAELRRVQPSPAAGFAKLRPELNKSRQRAKWRYHGFQLLVASSSLAALVLVALFVYLALPTNQWHSLKNQLQQQSPLFDRPWADPIPYQNHLTSDGQMALNQLAETTIYHLAVTVSNDLSQISGREAIRYVNRSGRELSTLYLQLPPNPALHPLTLNALLLDGRPLSPQLVSEGVIALPLFEPLAPAGQLIIETTFQLTLGQNRRDFNGTLALINGVLSLNNFFPVATAEISNLNSLELPIEDSFFLLQIMAPAGTTILTSGSPTDPIGNLPTFAAGPTNNVYATISEQFSLKNSATVGQTTINSYINAEHLAPRAEQALQAAVQALTIYNAQFGPYPFRELDLIGTPTLDFSRSSVTFPGVVLISYPFSGAQDFPEKMALSGVAQQWFSRIAGRQLQQEAWFFCGLSEYSRVYVPAGTIEDLLAEWHYRTAESSKEGMLPPTSSDCAALGAITLSQLAQQIGQEPLDASLRDFYQKFQWQRPTAADFQQIAESHCQCRLASFFANWQRLNDSQ